MNYCSYEKQTWAKGILPEIILEQIDPKVACQALPLYPGKVLRRRRTNGMNKKMKEMENR